MRVSLYEKTIPASHASKLGAACAALLALAAGCAIQTQPRGLRPQAKPVENKPASFTFAVIGDTRPGRLVIPKDNASPSADYLKNIDAINRAEPDFTILVGDMVRGYNTRQGNLLERQWHEFDKTVARYDAPLYMVMGNHDVWDKHSYETYKKRYGAPYYSFDHKGTHFISLSSEIPGQMNRITGKQLEWLAKDLEKAKGAAHKFLFIHKPLWVDGTDYSGQGAWMKEIQPLLLKYKVDAVFAGHEHYYEPFNVQGIPCFITGGGGAELDAWPKLGGFFHFLKVSVPLKGKAKIEVVKDGKEYPSNIILKGFRRMVAGVKQSLDNGGTWILNPKKGTRVEFQFNNTFKETMQLCLEWKNGPSGNPVERIIAPQRCDVFLEPKRVKNIVFFASPITNPGDIPKLEWKLYEQGELIVKGEMSPPVARQGEFQTMKRKTKKTILKMNERARVVGGRGNWTGPKDCSANIQVVKGETGLLIVADVKDDVLAANAKRDDLNDHVEFFFDMRPETQRGKGRYDKGVFRVVATPFFATAKKDEFYFQPARAEIQGTMFRSNPIPGGYRVELFIPYDGLGKQHLQAGKAFNFDFGINDNDENGQRPSFMMWSGDKRNRWSTARFGRLRETK